jgi:hypothetical protein
MHNTEPNANQLDEDVSILIKELETLALDKNGHGYRFPFNMAEFKQEMHGAVYAFLGKHCSVLDKERLSGAQLVCVGCQQYGQPAERNNQHWPDMSGGAISISHAHAVSGGRYMPCHAAGIWNLETSKPDIKMPYEQAKQFASLIGNWVEDDGNLGVAVPTLEKYITHLLSGKPKIAPLNYSQESIAGGERSKKPGWGLREIESTQCKSAS